MVEIYGRDCTVRVFECLVENIDARSLARWLVGEIRRNPEGVLRFDCTNKANERHVLFLEVGQAETYDVDPADPNQLPVVQIRGRVVGPLPEGELTTLEIFYKLIPELSDSPQPYPVVTIECQDIGERDSYVTVMVCDFVGLDIYARALQDSIRRVFKTKWCREFDEDAWALPPDRLGKAGPTERTLLRAEVFKKIKTKHPDWTQIQVAEAAARELKDDDITTATVRNVYNSLGWKWEKGERSR
jgi:hypothetical protein